MRVLITGGRNFNDELLLEKSLNSLLPGGGKPLHLTQNDDEVFEWMSSRKTNIPQDRRHLLRKNYKLLLNKMPKNINDEDNALEWQMLLALFVDNKVKPPKIILEQGIKATKWLMGEHASEFNKSWC